MAFVQPCRLVDTKQLGGAAVGYLHPPFRIEQQHTIVDVGEQLPIEAAVAADLMDQPAQLPARQTGHQHTEHQHHRAVQRAAQPRQLVTGERLADHRVDREAYRRRDREQGQLAVDADAFDQRRLHLAEQRTNRRGGREGLADELHGLRDAIEHDAAAIHHARAHVLLKPEAFEQLADPVGIDHRANHQPAVLRVRLADQQRQQVAGMPGQQERLAEGRLRAGRILQLTDLLAKLPGCRAPLAVDGEQLAAAEHEEIVGYRVVAHGIGEQTQDLRLVAHRLARVGQVGGQRADALVALLQQGADIAFEGTRQRRRVLPHLAGAGLVVAIDAPAGQADQQRQDQHHGRVEDHPDTLVLRYPLGAGEVIEVAAHDDPSGTDEHSMQSGFIAFISLPWIRRQGNVPRPGGSIRYGCCLKGKAAGNRPFPGRSVGNEGLRANGRKARKATKIPEKCIVAMTMHAAGSARRMVVDAISAQPTRPKYHMVWQEYRHISDYRNSRSSQERSPSPAWREGERTPQPTLRCWFSQYGLRSSVFSTLPTPDSGSVSRNSTLRGHL
ncbi:hypothetical protein D3C78_586060 [compost metagenome]